MTVFDSKLPCRRMMHECASELSQKHDFPALCVWHCLKKDVNRESTDV